MKVCGLVFEPIIFENKEQPGSNKNIKRGFKKIKENFENSLKQINVSFAFIFYFCLAFPNFNFISNE